MNVPFLKFSIAEQLSRSGKESDLNSIFSTKSQIHLLEAGSKKCLFSPVPYSPQLKSSMRCVFETGLFLSPAHDSDLRFSLREFFLPHQSSALHPLTQSELVEEGGRAYCLRNVL